ncbi:MAG TPA: transmembrane 220 family protein [Agriterribacter sp.]|nr:transmembrane 220 family protein [Agriterribacter sp.]
MKVFNITFCMLFVIAAALQYNDPDPWLWVPLYLYGAAMCWLAFRGKYYPGAYLVGIAVYLAYALYKFFEHEGALSWITEHHAENIAGTMKAATPWIEDTREFFGLIILSGVLFINYRRAKKEPGA